MADRAFYLVIYSISIVSAGLLLGILIEEGQVIEAHLAGALIVLSGWRLAVHFVAIAKSG